MSRLTSLATAVANITKPVTKNNFGPSTAKPNASLVFARILQTEITGHRNDLVNELIRVGGGAALAYLWKS